MDSKAFGECLTVTTEVAYDGNILKTPIIPRLASWIGLVIFGSHQRLFSYLQTVNPQRPRRCSSITPSFLICERFLALFTGGQPRCKHVSICSCASLLPPPLAIGDEQSTVVHWTTKESGQARKWLIICEEPAEAQF